MILITAPISAFTAFCCSILATMSIEKLGGRAGSVIASSPTTIVSFSIALSYSQSGDFDAIQKSLFTIPVGMLINVGFLLSWKELPNLKYFADMKSSNRLLIFLIFSSLLIWSLLVLGANFLIAALLTQNISIIAIGITAILISLFLGLLTVIYRPLPSPRGINKVSIPVYLSRGLLAGSAVGIGIYLSTVSSTAAAFAAAFPAIFLTSMISLWLSHHHGVSIGAVGPLCLSSVSVSVYATVFSLLITEFNNGKYNNLEFLDTVIISLFISYAIAITCVSIPVFFILQWASQRSAIIQPNANIIQNDIQLQTAEEAELEGRNQYLNSNPNENANADENPNETQKPQQPNASMNENQLNNNETLVETIVDC